MKGFVRSLEDVIANVKTLDHYSRGSTAERKFSRARIKNGKLFVALPFEETYLFAPSKFAGYKDNDIGHAEQLFRRDGRETNVEISRLLGPFIDSKHPAYSDIDDAYRAYCKALGVKPSRHHRERRYWLASAPLSSEFRYPEETLEDEYKEGAATRVLVNSYERNPAARAACIAHYGPQCSVCDFNFSEKYGELGRGYIHVHHVVPISSIRSEYSIDPIRDLRPVCPNCHAMLHREELRSIEELKSLISTSTGSGASRSRRGHRTNRGRAAGA